MLIPINGIPHTVSDFSLDVDLPAGETREIRPPAGSIYVFTSVSLLDGDNAVDVAFSISEAKIKLCCLRLLPGDTVHRKIMAMPTIPVGVECPEVDVKIRLSGGRLDSANRPLPAD